jgi:diguanylate cyclase (GGDEF)-like protein
MADLTSGDASGDGRDDGQQDEPAGQASSNGNVDLANDGSVYAAARDLTARGARGRNVTAEPRMVAADRRDEAATGRDSAAAVRDQIAELRDRELAARDGAWIDERRALTGADVVMRAAVTRRRAAADRALAAEARARAAADREQAARDREQAARDRLQAQADREALLQQLLVAETDALTGTRTRAAGLVELDHEIDRARRSGNRLVIAYIDVVGLKTINDTQGHAAGDALLQRTVVAIRRHVRSYDLMIRLGGDEFLCVLSGATSHDARRRFRSVQKTLADAPQPSEIKVGFASLAPQDTRDELIERADSQLPRRAPLT